MTKFSKDAREQLIALMLYHLFRRPDGLDAYCIADQIGATKNDEKDCILDNSESVILKAWLELGCKVNFCLLEGKGNLSHLLMTPFEFERLRTTAQESHAQIKRLRIQASKRWSSDWKSVEAKIIAAKGLLQGRPRQESLALTWQSVQADCARKLELMGRQEEAQQVQALSLKGLSISANNN